jgi:lipopolysaccharide transport system permease protein
MSRTSSEEDYVAASENLSSWHPFCMIPSMTAAELKAESNHTFGGGLWWFADPTLSILVYYLAFSMILKTGGPSFVAFLCVGTIAWRWFNGAVLRGSGAILQQSQLLQNVYLHKSILIAVSWCVDGFKFLMTLIPLLGVLILLGYVPSVTWLALPAVVLVQGLFIASLMAVLATVIPFFPDVQNLLNHIMHLLLFLSGVFFNLDDLPRRMRAVMMFNPMAGLIQAYRDCLLYGRWPDGIYLGVVGAGSVLVLALAYRWISKLDRVFPKIC